MIERSIEGIEVSGLGTAELIRRVNDRANLEFWQGLGYDEPTKPEVDKRAAMAAAELVKIATDQ